MAFPKEFQEQLEAGRKALEKARQVLNPSPGTGSAPDSSKKAHKPKPKAPEPIRPVNTARGMRLSPATLPSSSGGLKPLDYPPEFPPEARDRVERAKIRASRELLPASVYDSKDQELAVRCIMRIFLAFAKETSATRKEHRWSIDRVQREAEEFLRRLTIKVVFDKFPGLDLYWISNWNGSIAPDVERRFRASKNRDGKSAGRRPGKRPER